MTELKKNAKWDEVYTYALEKYKGDESKALSFTRGWFNYGSNVSKDTK